MKKLLLSASLFLIVTVALSGCSSKVTKSETGKLDPETENKMYEFGVRNPKIENQQSVIEYAIINGIETDNLYAFRDSVTQAGFYASKIGIPEMDFYNKDGNLMKYKNEQKCNAQDEGLIHYLDPKNVVGIDSSRNLYKYLSELRTLDNKGLNRNDFTGYDYYVVIYWAKWGGDMNKTHVPMWEKAIKEKSGLRIKVISLTADYMDYWHPSEKKLFKIYNPEFTKAN